MSETTEVLILWFALRMQRSYSIQIKDGNTNMQNTNDYLQSITLPKVCLEKGIVWIMVQWKTSSAGLRLKCSMAKNSKVLLLSLMN